MLRRIGVHNLIGGNMRKQRVGKRLPLYRIEAEQREEFGPTLVPGMAAIV